jgi:hypothetical protein
MGMALVTVLTLLLGGATCILAWKIVQSQREQHDLTNLAFGMMLLAGAVLATALPYIVWHIENSPSYELDKSEWTCTRSHEERSVTVVSTGKTTVPVPTVTTVCTVYERGL